MLRRERLNEDGPALRVVGDGNSVHAVVERCPSYFVRISVTVRQGVTGGDAVEAVVRLLKRQPVLQRPDQMADVQLARRPHAGNNAWVRHVEKSREWMTVSTAASRRCAPRWGSQSGRGCRSAGGRT